MNPDTTTARWLAEQQALAGLSDDTLASALGYESTKVITMMKAGQMSIPLDKAPQLAHTLDVNPGALMRRLLHDTAPNLLTAIEHCMGPLTLTEGERRLIEAVRKANLGREPVPITFDRDSIITLVVA